MFKLCSYIAFRIFLTKIWTVRKLMVDSEAEITELEIYTPISYMHTFCKRSESSKFKVRKKNVQFGEKMMSVLRMCTVT